MIQPKLAQHCAVAAQGIDQNIASAKGEARLFPAHRFVAATTSVLIASAFIASLSAVGARAEDACEASGEVAILASPVAPWRGAPLRVIVAVENASAGELSLIDPTGRVAARSRAAHGGPPYFWVAEVASPAAGTWRATLTRDRASAGCGTVARNIAVRDTAPPPPQAAGGSVWPVRDGWNRGTENLFSAWIETLFEAPLDAAPSWPALHEVLRDRSRNFLFDHLGLREDEMKIVLRPDCADLPYFLRAYFAFKLGLPFGFSKCSRGGGGQPPKCFGWSSIQNASGNGGLAAAFARYVRAISDGVHSGTGRTPANDDNTDYYPVPLTQKALRPGTVYADPYGHILMLVKRVPQTRGAAGVFLAVDGQPDGTVARKRYWRGNFLFAQDRALGGAGFKHFRPIVRGKNGALRRLTNAEIARDAQYGDFSLQQAKLGVEDFYDRMDDVMSPAPLDPRRALEEAITSLEEQVKVRVTSVENGRKFQNSGKGEASMPEGAAIFETIGPWEDFSTPSRDLRLLIAIDVVRHFPERVARRPERYAMPMGKSAATVKAELESVLASELASRRFAYTRSDGSPWTLALRDVFERATALEMAYNPNDCVELRWGAPEGSQEAATCRRHAPSAQRAKMSKYRAWFHERRRPPRA
jgi:hypothetical protein